MMIVSLWMLIKTKQRFNGRHGFSGLLNSFFGHSSGKKIHFLGHIK
jgi:hypothetical protein